MSPYVKTKIGSGLLSRDASRAASDLAQSFSTRYRALAGARFRQNNPSNAIDKTALLAEVSNDVLCLNVNTSKNQILKVWRTPICGGVIQCTADLNYFSIGRQT